MKALIRFFPVALVVGICLAGVPLAAQFGALEGTVRDYEGKPIVDAQIVIERLDIKGKYEVKTDKKGYYFYMGLPSGPQTRYKIQIVREGQVLYTSEIGSIPTQEYRRLDIDLAKEREQQAAQLTEEQKKQLEQMQKEQQEFKSVKEHFDVGRQLMETASADFVCSIRCQRESVNSENCLVACRGQSNQALKQAAYQEAALEFEQAAAVDPEQYAVWVNLGLAYSSVNDAEKAIGAYEKAIALKADDAGVYNNLGSLYARTGKVEEAKQAFEKAAGLDPTRAATYYFNLGATLVNQGEMKAAAEPLKKCLELDPSRAAAWYWLGVSLYANAEYKQEGGVFKTLLQPGTVEAFQKYLELEPNGQYAESARQNLQVIEAQVPASVRIKKKN